MAPKSAADKMRAAQEVTSLSGLVASAGAAALNMFLLLQAARMRREEAARMRKAQCTVAAFFRCLSPHRCPQAAEDAAALEKLERERAAAAKASATTRTSDDPDSGCAPYILCPARFTRCGPCRP